MAFVKRKTLLILIGLSVIAVLAVAGFIWSGLYNIGADDPHMGPVYSALETLRERSIEVRANELQVPNLDDPARILQGAGNYAAMCTGCHLAPGMSETEMSRGLYPAPPDLTKTTVEAAEAFWVIKHGIKASGMPAWGKSMDDEYIWNMAAFLQKLPKLDAAQYQAMVASSGGHDHGGGETKPHEHAEGEADGHGDMAGMAMEGEAKPHTHAPGTPPHDDAPAEPHAGMEMGASDATDESTPHPHPPGTPADHDAAAAPAKPAPEPASGTVEHRHADGTVESHPVEPQPTTTPTPPKPEVTPEADDGHQHQH